MGMKTPPDPPTARGRGELSPDGRRHRVAPVVTLFLMAPLLGEVVGAALRLSYFVEPLRVVSILCFYGAGVVLLREIAQRLRLNGWGIVLLGVAYALIEEGLALQTIFNPQGMDGETMYGRAAGVNWFWAVLVCGYHVVWSVLIPIGVVHILFPRESGSPWLSRRKLAVFGGVFALGTALFALISLLRSDFRLSVVEIGAVLAIVGMLTLTASRCRARDTPRVPQRLPGPMRAGWTGLGFGLVWFAFHLMAFIGGGISFVWWVLAAVLVAIAAAAIVARWVRHGWTARHQLAASLGAVLAAGLFGLLLVSLGDHLVDVVFEVIVIGGIVAGYVWARQRASPT
ncbi:putative Serine/arginine repetitive matrix protein 2 [Streptomyces afghaniensis 772] [Streptomyces afghaniensis]